jgi:hypothetical protein
MRIRWNDSDPAPVLIGYFDGFSIFFEGRRLFSRRTQELVWANTKRFADVIGPGHDVVSRAGWHYKATSPYCFTAVFNDQVVAAAWATHICTATGKEGCNLAYALLNHIEGRGVAKLLAALSFQAFFRDTPEVGFVNVQSRRSNIRSLSLAKSFGMQVVLEEGFDAVRPGSEPVTSYCTYRSEAQLFASTAEQVIAQRLLAPANGLDATESARDQVEVT